MATTTGNRLFLDWPHYALWWCVWIVVPGFLMALGGGQISGSQPLGMVLAIALLTVYALLAATLFALLQNSVNRHRRKPVSWALALAIWFALNIFSAFFLR